MAAVESGEVQADLRAGVYGKGSKVVFDEPGERGVE